MLKRLLVLVALLMLAIAAPIAAPPTAECEGYCRTTICYEQYECGPRCACIRIPPDRKDRKGHCVETWE